MLTTTTGLTFSGDNNNNALALRTSDGETLWHSTIGRVNNSPITYELDGRQYIMFAGGTSLFAFALPETPRATTNSGGWTMKSAAVVVFLFACVLFALSATGQGRIPVMLLDGQNNHDWRATTPVLKKVLDETGLFDTTIVTAPEIASVEFAAFKPDFSRYRAVVMNYNNGIDGKAPEWGDELKASFEQFVSNGGGVVSIHGADNAFPHWKAFNDMIGVGGWGGRDEKSGPLWYYKDGKAVSDETPGRAGAHGARLPFLVTVRQDHPDHQGAAESLDASHRRALYEPARAWRQDGHPRDGVCGSSKSRDRAGRADADGAAVRQGPRRALADGARRDGDELGRFRGAGATRNRVGRDRQRDAEDARQFPDGRDSQLSRRSAGDGPGLLGSTTDA